MSLKIEIPVVKPLAEYITEESASQWGGKRTLVDYNLENLRNQDNKKLPDKQVKTGTNERDKNGRFIKGKSGNPMGRPKKFTFSDYITEAEVKDLVKLAKQQAREGKSELIKFLLEQVFGKAKQSMDMEVDSRITLEDIMFENWQRRKESLDEYYDKKFEKDNSPELSRNV